MPATQSDLFTRLTALGITHNTLEHDPVFTVEEGTQIKAALPGGHTKNLFLKDKSGAFYLICALGSAPIKLNKLHNVIGSKRLSFANADMLLEKLGVTPGSVTLFSIINDRACEVSLILDAALFDDPLVNFHPLINTATTTLASDRIVDFAKSENHEPQIIDFKALQEATTAPT